MLELPTQLACLQEQLLSAAQNFATDAQELSQLLTAIVKDVARAVAEPLEIFPVCHHSPSSALQMVQRLQRQQPKVIYLELCEDLLPTVENIRDCKLPVALQAFAAESDTFSPELMPLSVVAPLTEAAAEYQAIAYTLQHRETTLVFVDRAVDFVFQWQPQAAENTEAKETPTSDEAKMHGTAIGVEIGMITPTFDYFLTFLLRNSNTRHFAEWWDQFVEQAIIGSDYQTYRQVMFLIGSLMRRLGRKDEDITSDRLREQYMWTRIKQHMQANQIVPTDAIYICGAAHAASDVAEFGLASETIGEIPPLTQTKWLYGLIPSSFAAIEYQFNHPAGTLALAETSWKKSLNVGKIQPFTVEKSQKQRQSKSKRQISQPQVEDELINFLTRPPQLAAADTEQLLSWCADIVALARKNAYLASTADAIAIYQTSMLLAGMRNRTHPTPYDFQDAAITCLEKDRTPKKRNIRQLCQILLGGDRIGTVGYTSLPPLAQNVYERLAPLNINLQSSTNQRALMDFKQNPDYLPCSDVLWRLNYLLSNSICQPIIGERTLGYKPLQESWEIRIGKYQRDIIMLGYEGVTLEQVLEQRLKQAAFGTETKASTSLKAAEDSILYLHSPRLTQELGEQAMTLLQQETGAADAPSIFDRVRRLVHYYRTAATGLPPWIKQFVATGYSHYATLLPQAFEDKGTSPEQIAGMLGFIFTLESLALSLGCNRTQLVIGVQQAASVAADPAKLGLLWTTEWLLKHRSLAEIRDFFEQVLSNPMLTEAFPDYLNGFILALTFAPRMGKFVVELLSQVFASVPDQILLPWLPSLILRMRSHSQILPALISEAAASFPNQLSEFDRWLPPWLEETPPPVKVTTVLSEQEQSVRQMLFDSRTTTSAMAQLLGVDSTNWSETSMAVVNAQSSLLEEEAAVKALLHSQPVTMAALSNLLELGTQD